MRTHKKIPQSKRPLFIFITVAVLLGFILALSFDTYIKQLTKKAAESLDISTNQFIFLVEREKRRNNPLKLPILFYHYVEVVTDERDTIRKSLNIEPIVFESQLMTLKNYGYTPIHLGQLINYYDNKNPLPPKPIIITFDDGYRDFYTDVLPIIKRQQVKVTLYMVSGFRDYTKNFLTTPQLLEIAKEPLVEIGAHSANHFNLAYIPLAQATAEIEASKKDLEKLIGKPVTHFAFPYGAFTPAVQQATQKSGFQTASTIDPGIIQFYSQRFGLKRIRPGRMTGNDFITHIENFA